MLPVISSTPIASRSSPEYRIWTEQFLARYCLLTVKSAEPDGIAGRSRLYTKETLAPFRAWAELPWTDPVQSGNTGQSTGTIKHLSSTRRRIWQLYYTALSTILQQGLPYPPIGHSPSTSTQAMSTENIKSVAGLKLQQSLELRRVQNIYEAILLKEVSFPKANEANVEVESWTDQVIANWRVILNSSWQNEDLGEGGKEAMTRTILAVCYRIWSAISVERLKRICSDPIPSCNTYIPFHSGTAPSVHRTYRTCRFRSCWQGLRYLHRLSRKGKSSRRQVWRG